MDSRIFLAGSSTAVITKTITAPLDRMKILYQTQELRSPGKYKSLFSTIKTICKEEGFRGLYKGNFVNSLRVIPSYSLKFTFNDYYKKKLLTKKPTIGELVGIGLLTGASQIAITYPLDILRTRYSLYETRGTIINYLKYMVKTEGMSSLYKGIPISLTTGSMHVGLQLSSFDIYKGLSDTNNITNKILCGSAAGVTAGLITYPGDMIKKRMHTNGILGENKIYKNTFDCMKQIMKKESIKGFYKGVGICTLKTIPTAAIQFTIFDLVSNHIKK